MTKATTYNRLFLIAVLLISFAINGFSQISISGPTKVNAASSSCYTATTTCSTTGYCWTVSAGSIDNTNCGGIIVESSPMKMESAMVTPNYAQPPPGGCSQAAGVTVNFNNYSTLTTVSVTVQNNCGPTASMNVTVVPKLNTVSATPVSQTVSCGVTASVLTCSYPSGGDGTYYYQWQTSSDNTNWTDISGATSRSYTPSGYPATGTTYYRAKVQSFDYIQYSNSSSLTASSYPPLNGGTVSNIAQTINYSTVPATINCSLGSGGTCSVVTYPYQWQSSIDGSNWSDISGATAQNYSPPALMATTFYRRRTTYNGSSVYSNTSIITVYPQLVAGTISADVLSILTGASPGELTGTTSEGGDGNYTYAWQNSADNITWTDIGTDINYLPPTLTATTYYRRVTTSNGITANSNVLMIEVHSLQPLTGGIISSSAPVISSGGSITLSGGSASGSTCSTYTYQYQSSSDEQNWVNIGSATVTNILATTYFRRQAVCGSEIAFSNTVRVKVKATTPTTITPNSTTSPAAGTATAISIPIYGTVDVNNMNYVKSRNFTEAGITSISSANSQTDNYAVQQSTEYLDGLGRSIQTVSKQATPLGHDVIASTFYDAFGRVAQQYLPYSDNGTTGSFRTDIATTQPAFYNTQFSNTEGYYYSNTKYEASPLNRTLKTTAAGKSWTGHDIGVSQLSRTNEVYDSVKIWTIGYNEDDLPVTTAAYAPGTLYVQETTDENDNKVIEYKDMDGQVILKKVQSLDAELPGHYGWLCTYYVYDDLGNLRFVIPPRAIEYLQSHSWALTTAVRDNLCFSYLYDGRKRMIMKLVPNAGKTYMVYNARDLVVMTQDANERATAQWNYSKYDRLNRITGVGLYPSSITRASYQLYGDTATYWPGTAISDSYLKSQTYYDDYSWVTSSITTSNGITGTMNTGVYSGFTTTYNTSPVFAVAPVVSYMTRGAVTGTMTKVLEGGQTLYNVSFYDDNNRVIQTQSNNISAANAVDYTTTQYNFAGKPINTYVQENKKGTLALTTGILTKNTYDAQGRILNISKTINTGTAKTFATYTYNELGQLSNKSIGTLNGTALDNLAYTYNIRGWMSSINKPYLSANTSASVPSAGNYFGMELDYDYGFNQTQVNGNIAGAKWKSAGDQYARAFGYDYDNANRILKGDFTQTQTSSGYAHDATVDFSVSGISYDANGNLMSMKQNGLLTGSSNTIDNLTYKYSGNSGYTNQLSSVTDAIIANNHLGDFYDANTGDNDYTYDANGNLTSDKNKAIASIVYNYLNLPETITITGKGTISYVYDASGNKLKKTVLDQTVTPNKTTVTTYIGGFVYQNDTLQFAGHEEGRIRPQLINPATGYTPSNINWVYDYFEKDHLGNTRMVLTEEQKTNLYPAATLEGTYDASSNSMVNFEKNFYRIDNTKITAETSIPSWGTETVANTKLYYNNNGNPPANTNYPAGCTPLQTDGSTKLYKLNGATNQTGLEFMIKVMAGDHIDIFGKSYYLNTTTITNSNSTTLNVLTLMTNMLLAPGNAAAAKGITASQLNTINSGAIPSSFFRGSNSEPTTTVPKAYINYIFLDENFKYAGGGASRVGVSGSVKDHWTSDAQLQNITVPKNGYIFVYVSNESNFDVFFDNLQVIQKPGPIMEETHYYPFGLTMAGISAKAIGELQNKEKTFQGQRFDDDLGLDWVQFKWRNHDPQIGRFIEIDPLADDYVYNSPYAFSENKVTGHVELEGLEAITAPLPIPSISVPEGYAPEVGGAIGVLIDLSNAADDRIKDIYAHPENYPGNKTAEMALQNRVDKANAQAKVELSKPLILPADTKKVDSKAEERAAKLSKKDRSGKDFTKAGKNAVKNVNREKNNGEMVCENCGTGTQNASKHTRGQTPPSNEAHVDHIEPKSNGGSGTPDNGQVLCRDCNLKKGAN
jgi:RHS repeat-associated protein